jgi:dTDP-glucose 4,6-dehydratase
MAESHRPRALLVTGGAGFIGSNYIRFLLEADAEARVINLDALTYAGNNASLRDVAAKHGRRYEFIHETICNQARVRAILAEGCVDTIVNFAAESHVDRSISGPAAFIDTNIVGTYSLLEAARAVWRDRADVRFHHISTDEVYGSLGASGLFSETTPYDPSSPYSASKAASDHLVRAWQRTFKLPVSISNCSNNFGPYQFPEKLIPVMIENALHGKALPVYGDGMNIRDWLYVEDHCRAIDLIIRRGAPGCTYNIGARNEWTNIAIVHLICDLVDELRPRPGQSSRRSLVTFVTDRPGHDRRYAIDPTAIERDLNWRPRDSFESAMRRTVTWYLENEAWLREIRAAKRAAQ